MDSIHVEYQMESKMEGGPILSEVKDDLNLLFLAKLIFVETSSIIMPPTDCVSLNIVVYLILAKLCKLMSLVYKKSLIVS